MWRAVWKTELKNLAEPQNHLCPKLRSLLCSRECCLYEVSCDTAEKVQQLVFSTPETRQICNDPFLAGTAYTAALRQGCAKALSAMHTCRILDWQDFSTVVLHILRGGLNFGLREALAEALGFRHHGSAFVSAQRARKKDQPQDWIITESQYQKLTLHGVSHIVFGDVVATGTSLEHALQRLLEAARQHDFALADITFFTIGSQRSREIIANVDNQCRQLFKAYRGSRVVYVEGIFETATLNTPMRIKIDGTDLLRCGSLLTPEFIASQYESASYPLERCTIYDAGSRAFDLQEYFHDIYDYWLQTLKLAESGVTFGELLAERFPALEAERFAEVGLAELCRRQLDKIPVYFKEATSLPHCSED